MFCRRGSQNLERRSKHGVECFHPTGEKPARAGVRTGSPGVKQEALFKGTAMSRARIRPDIAERVLGHVIDGVEGVYDRHDYDAERETALLTLATLIETILRPPTKGGNVVSINRR